MSCCVLDVVSLLVWKWCVIVVVKGWEFIWVSSSVMLLFGFLGILVWMSCLGSLDSFRLVRFLRVVVIELILLLRLCLCCFMRLLV